MILKLDWGNNDGLIPWSLLTNNRPSSNVEGEIAHFLEELKADVCKHASSRHIRDVAKSIELPAEYCEFVKRAYCISYDNWEKTNSICAFGGSGDSKVPNLEELKSRMCVVEYDVAAGWLVGSCSGWRMAYLLSRPKDAPLDPWRWRIISHRIDIADIESFGSLEGLLTGTLVVIIG